jgi:2,3-bisphosphoglycerate-dependent phosphoglycerate mutase
MNRTQSGRLFLVRHGQSTFNAADRFTGWSDPPLTARGEAQARAIANQLAAGGVKIDVAFTSTLARAVRTTGLILQDMQSVAAMHRDAALNERDYGDLTDLSKEETAALWGADQVRAWRRSYTMGPPNGESLRDVVARVAPYYLRVILSHVLRRATVIVVAHGNTLRALVMALEGLSPLAVENLEIATGEIVEYDVAVDATARRVHHAELPLREVPSV